MNRYLLMMQFFLYSIRGRLLVAGLFLTGIALVITSFAIGHELDRFVRRGLDDRLDAQVGLLLRSVRPDGTVDVRMLEEIGPFTQYRRGWSWSIETPQGTHSSGEIVKIDDIRLEGRSGREGRFMAPPEHLQSGQSDDVYLRIFEKQMDFGLLRITSAAPRQAFYRIRQEATLPVQLTLAGLGIVLLLTTFLQLHIGLRPLARLKTALADVRSGALDRIPADQPAELTPVVTELNGLLDENEVALARARGHVSNLAHSLKTPLATLTLRLGEARRDPTGEMADLVGQIGQAIRHHLGRARAASPGAPGRRQLPVSTTVAELIEALGRIHAERGIEASLEIPERATVKCDPQDFDEMLGNLLDNAWKWTKSRIVVGAQEDGKITRIIIDDDGPGLSKAAIDQALVPGMRLDERGDGHGFGLSIARELAELHGGALGLGPSPLGGLRATLTLPA